RIATIGSPEGLTNSVSDGIVSAIRTDGRQRFFQISAPISPGSSGGPVLNLEGQVVAISTFQLVEGQNLNFAIPADNIATVEARQTDVSLQQLYWQQHLSMARKSQRQSPDNAEQTATRAESTRSLTGTFLGTVHNLTADLQATFGLFVEENRNTISGCMAVRKPLYGSGPLFGAVNGTVVQFDVPGPPWIHFEGELSGDHISGTYRVQSSAGAVQDGEFVLDRADAKRLPPSFDPQKDCPTDVDINH
ncbi:MAG: trypsin-like peptidase domain-containing protein, partial [Blastocatellia bacterium]